MVVWLLTKRRRLHVWKSRHKSRHKEQLLLTHPTKTTPRFWEGEFAEEPRELLACRTMSINSPQVVMIILPSCFLTLCLGDMTTQPPQWNFTKAGYMKFACRRLGEALAVNPNVTLQRSNTHCHHC